MIGLNATVVWSTKSHPTVKGFYKNTNTTGHCESSMLEAFACEETVLSRRHVRSQSWSIGGGGASYYIYMCIYIYIYVCVYVN